jgi:DNA-binding NarL/FixJ family response regulator
VGDPVRLVIVEDNHTFRETLELLLPLRAGIEVVAAVARGADAVEACARLQPDVAVIDYRMPGLDGEQTTVALLQASPHAGRLPDRLDHRRGGRSRACSRCRRLLTKDQSLDEIVAVIRAAAVEA